MFIEPIFTVEDCQQQSKYIDGQIRKTISCRLNELCLKSAIRRDNLVAQLVTQLVEGATCCTARFEGSGDNFPIPFILTTTVEALDSPHNQVGVQSEAITDETYFIPDSINIQQLNIAMSSNRFSKKKRMLYVAPVRKKSRGKEKCFFLVFPEDISLWW